MSEIPINTLKIGSFMQSKILNCHIKKITLKPPPSKNSQVLGYIGVRASFPSHPQLFPLPSFFGSIRWFPDSNKKDNCAYCHSSKFSAEQTIGQWLGCGNILSASQSDKREKINLLSVMWVWLESILEMKSVLSGWGHSPLHLLH